MERQIKFRAWVQEYNPSKEAATMVYSDRIGGVSVLFRDFESDPIMQFTGLTDCDGAEVYEGDLFQVSLKYARTQSMAKEESLPERLYTFVVDFHPYAGFRLNSVTERLDKVGKNLNCEDAYLLNRPTIKNIKSMRIVGNIYQNPERLNDTTKSK